MKNKLKSLCTLLTGILIGSLSVVGANQAIQAIQNTNIKVSLNGQVQEFKDETTGEAQYPITYNDRTYLPLRNVANLAGLSVDYDNNTNTAVLNYKNNVSNTLNYDTMKKQLEDISNVTILDIDKNGVPEAIKLGSYLSEELPFQVYSFNNDNIISLSNNVNLFSNVFIIYETENGTYLYENSDDGPVHDIAIYELIVDGLKLDAKQVLRRCTEKSYSEEGDYLGLVDDSYYVNGNAVNEKEYNEKIDELNKIKIINKNVYREEKNVGRVDYENLWN